MAPLRLFALLLVALVSVDVGDSRVAALRAACVPPDGADRALVAARLARMNASPFVFYRATIALFLRDWRADTAGLARSRFDVAGATPVGVGDAHVENFGTLVGRDGRVTFEPDDLDGADRVPYLWDLRRLTVSLCLAARASNPRARAARSAAVEAARDVARDAALAYATALCAPDGADPPSAVTASLLRRAQSDADARAELTELTEVVAGVRRLRRGALDPDEPDERIVDLSPTSRAELAGLFEAYRSSLRPAPAASFFTVLDAAREYGKGAMNFASSRVVALVRGPTEAPDDDVIVEVKELAAAVTPAAPASDPAARVLAARDALWSRPDADPYWGATTWRGCSVQVRTETAGARGLRVARLVGPLGTPEALRELARALGARLARIHRRTLPTPAPQAAAIARDPTGFADEQADASMRYAAQVLDDWRRLQRMVRARDRGLGLRGLRGERPRSGACALFAGP